MFYPFFYVFQHEVEVFTVCVNLIVAERFVDFDEAEPFVGFDAGDIGEG